MAQLPQDRLVRKEVALGIVREAPQPEAHIGLSLIAPFLAVQSDDVIFDYTIGLAAGLAPARAEDAESELAQKDDTVGTGRAAIIDWAIKDHYDPSDVSRFREAFLLGLTQDSYESFPLTINNIKEGFEQRVARDALVRRRKLDNRIEWLIMSALDTGVISYNDGKVVFSVDFQRPANQTNASVTSWTDPASDPIDAILDVQDFMYDTQGVRTNRALASSKIIRNILNSAKFAQRAGFASTAQTTVDPRYAIDGWGIEAALGVVERATGVTLIPYDSVYRTRPIGSTTFTNNRFTSENHLIFLPNEEDIAEVSDTEIGFAATLTSPHPESNWQPGYYEWERSTVDPWGEDFGSGIKAFPVFPHLEYTYRLKVL